MDPRPGSLQARLAALLEATQAVASSLDLEEVLQTIVREAAGIADAPFVRLFLLDEAARVLRYRVGVGLPLEAERDIVIPLGEGFSGQVGASGQPLAVPDCRGDSRLRYPQHAATYGLVSYLGLPVQLKGRLFGVLVFNTSAPRVYTEGEVVFLSAFARQAALAIENARLYAAIRQHAAEMEERVRQRTVELEEALRVKSEFLANMSHELRTPLNAIIGFCELLRDSTFGPLTEKQTRFLGNIHKGGQHLLALFNDLLDLSTAEAGRLHLHPEPLELRDVLESILRDLRSQADGKGLALDLHVDPALGMLNADPVRFKQILYNLLSNAVKFTPDGGHVTVTARRIADCRLQIADLPPTQSEISNLKSEMLEIAVTDTGVGIKAEDLPKLFRPLTQLEPVRTKRYQGTGLGLALTKRLVELHGGRVWAESEGEGRGSTFTFVLPPAGPKR
ncbi:MAG: GAF domain-containing protein [candidate division NC10 bacterium]|nr:GAF domain-containing protein [candidate division NC10 bacterium]